MGTLQPNLVPLCELKALLQPAIAVTLPGQGGLQIGEVAEARITGSRFSGVMIGTASDWLAMAPDGSWGRMERPRIFQGGRRCDLRRAIRRAYPH
jgi:hypothetical protein